MAQNSPVSRAHEWLAQAAGIWDVQGHYFVGDGQESFEAKGVETVEMIGPFWQQSKMEIELFDSVVHGVTYLGFDPTRQVFVSTWIDSANPFLYRYEGAYDDATKLLSMSGVNTDPNTGKPATYRSLGSYDLPAERTFTLSVEVASGDEFEILSYEYRRR